MDQAATVNSRWKIACIGYEIDFFLCNIKALKICVKIADAVFAGKDTEGYTYT